MVGEAGLELLDLLAKLHEFSGLDSELLNKVLVCALEAVEHFAIGGRVGGQVGKSFSGFVGKGFHCHGVVGLVETSGLCGVAHVVEIRVG